MKKFDYCLFALGMLLAVGCTKTEVKTETKNKIGTPVVDVTKTYPKKEIVLQDIADVEYIPLETRDNVLLSENRKITYVSRDTIMICSARTGDVFFFDGKGKFLHSFNKKGQSGREYLSMIEVTFDAKNKEVFVYDVLGGKQRILVYSEKGVYKRTLLPKVDALDKIVNYDSETLFAFEGLTFGNKNKKDINKTPFLFLSKKTGKVDTLKSFYIKDRENAVKGQMLNGMMIYFQVLDSYINPLKKSNSFVLNDLSADTIFEYAKHKKLTPICIKTPKLKEQEGTQKLVVIDRVNEKHLFVSVRLREMSLKGFSLLDFRKNKVKFPESTHLIINRATSEISECKVLNKDILDTNFKLTPQTELLDTDDILELLEEGKLSGKLKEIAEKLKEDDNPVLMRVTLK